MKHLIALRRAAAAPLLILSALLATSCADDARGELAVTIYGEDFIEDTIPAADTDGWQITFSKFLIVVDQIEAKGVSIQAPHAFDLTKKSSGQGHMVHLLTGLEDGPIKPLSYRVSPPSGPLTMGDASAADKLLLSQRKLSLYVQGQAVKGQDTKTFTWEFDSATTYSGCQTTATIKGGQRAMSQLTIHADHFFYDDLVSEEPAVAFGLIAQADADGDGQVTRAELEASDITAQERYQVGNRTDIKNLWQFIAAQTATLGHIDGEGHCDAR